MNILVEPNEYFSHEYNTTIQSERAVEVPLAMRWLSENQISMEVGAVMPYYMECEHGIIDPYDKKGTIKDIVENINLINENVLSISTIEHIGIDCTDVIDGKKAIIALLKVMNEAKSYFITLPTGWNSDLDTWLTANISELNCFGYRKLSQTPPLWECVPNPIQANYKYGAPYQAANFVLFIGDSGQHWEYKC